MWENADQQCFLNLKKSIQVTYYFTEFCSDISCQSVPAVWRAFFFFLLIPLRVKISSFPGIPVASSYSLSLPAHKFTTSPATQECGLVLHRKSGQLWCIPCCISGISVPHIVSYLVTLLSFFFFFPLNIYCISLSTVKDFERRQAWITAVQLYLKLYWHPEECPGNCCLTRKTFSEQNKE